MYRHVTPFLKSIITSLSNGLVRDEIINFEKYASRILLLRVFLCALVSTYQIHAKFMLNVSS